MVVVDNNDKNNNNNNNNNTNIQPSFGAYVSLRISTTVQ